EPVPADLREMLEFMARVVQEGAEPWLKLSQASSVPPCLHVDSELPLVWHGPLMDPVGYADEARNFVLGLLDAGEPLAVAPVRWVPSEFNRETFVRSGVDPAKIAIVPGAMDPAPFAAVVEPWPVPGEERFRFLSLFDWTLHKGWDVLLEAFAREFGPENSPQR